MTELEDNALLTEYVRNGSEAAFATLVSRYVNLVHSAAIRFTSNPNHAEEITQAVFIILARKASSLRKDSVLSAWLYQTARLTAANFLRGEIRRQNREQEVYMDSTVTEPEAIWEQIAPLLDQAMGQLGETDRKAIVLRYFENKTAQQVAAKLKINEEAAKKRVNRAVEKLRKIFFERGIVLTASVIAGVVSANSVQAAPTALATSISTVGISKGAAASGSTLTLIKGVLKTMAWTKVKTAVVVGVGVLLAAGTAKVAITEIAAHRTPIWQEKYDLAVLGMVAPQTKILSPPPSRTAIVHLAGMSNGKRIGWGEDFPDVLMAAYGWQFNAGQLIFSVPVPKGRFDFISNLPKGQSEAMQQEIKKKFGLIGRREMIETNVLLLRVRSAKATGLRRTSGGHVAFSEGTDSLVSHNQSLVGFVDFLRRNLGILVINRTKFRDDLDIDLKWDGTPEGLKQATLDQLGLELVPSKESVEFLVVEKAN